MKKTFALLMAVVMCLALCACGTSPEPQIDESDNTTVAESSCRRDRMSESEKEEAASRGAVEEVVRRLENKGYYLDNGKYKIGSVIKVEDDIYEVSGTIYIYDKYGSIDETVTFSCDTVWITERGSGVSVGAVDMNF